MSCQFKKPVYLISPGDSIIWRRPFPLFLRTTQQHTAVYATCDDLDSVLKRDWINRVWTYQEILLATHPIVVCGDIHVPWSQFEKSILFLSESMLSGLEHIIRSWKRVVLTRDVTDSLKSYRAFLQKSASYFFNIKTWIRVTWGIC